MGETSPPPFVPSMSRDLVEAVTHTSLDFARDTRMWSRFTGEQA